LQNSAAKVVCQAARRDSPRLLLHRLHWLPVKQRIDFKVAVLTAKALSIGEPCYIRELIVVNRPSRSMRSLIANKLVVPSRNNGTALAGRGFQNYAPTLWNNMLSPPLRALVLAQEANETFSISSFRQRLKTELFAAAFAGLN
jgi:hypothetical protein